MDRIRLQVRARSGTVRGCVSAGQLRSDVVSLIRKNAQIDDALLEIRLPYVRPRLGMIRAFRLHKNKAIDQPSIRPSDASFQLARGELLRQLNVGVFDFLARTNRDDGCRLPIML